MPDISKKYYDKYYLGKTGLRRNIDTLYVHCTYLVLKKRLHIMMWRKYLIAWVIWVLAKHDFKENYSQIIAFSKNIAFSTWIPMSNHK